ncbi:MAG: polymerase, sigma-24 subunit, subfamily [Acidimicrobiales bacterium]|nr:polymerase, sigma-24 subunit, subfamily [Acidimicrobiales bacterium]
MSHGPENPADRFESLYGANARPLLAYALRRVSQPADAADVVAETFLVAWRRLADVPPAPEARLWLFGVARKVMANQRRGDLRRSNLSSRLRDNLAGLVIPDISSATADARIVRHAMSTLDADDRELLWLSCWEGLTPTELAGVFDIPPPTARTRLHRARARLRAALRLQGFDGERIDGGGHGRADERPLVQDLGGER